MPLMIVLLSAGFVKKYMYDPVNFMNVIVGSGLLLKESKVGE